MTTTPGSNLPIDVETVLTGEGEFTFDLPDKFEEFSYVVSSVPGTPGASNSQDEDVVEVNVVRCYHDSFFRRKTYMQVRVAWKLVTPKVLSYWGF